MFRTNGPGSPLTSPPFPPLSETDHDLVLFRVNRGSPLPSPPSPPLSGTDHDLVLFRTNGPGSPLLNKSDGSDGIEVWLICCERPSLKAAPPWCSAAGFATAAALAATASQLASPPRPSFAALRTASADGELSLAFTFLRLDRLCSESSAPGTLPGFIAICSADLFPPSGSEGASRAIFLPPMIPSHCSQAMTNSWALVNIVNASVSSGLTSSGEPSN